VRRNFTRLAAISVTALSLAACRQDMHDQPRYRIASASRFWADGRSVRPEVPGTVARGNLKGTDSPYYTGKVNGRDIMEFPLPITREVIARGKDRFQIYCSPCHGLTGRGDGMVVTRGLKNPPSYHSDALREQPVGHFFDVITNGSGAMFSYAARVPVPDRWAIIAYIRVLQQSQNVKLTALTSDEVQKVKDSENPPKPAEKKEGGH
jgi:hypothetical protein